MKTFPSYTFDLVSESLDSPRILLMQIRKEISMDFSRHIKPLTGEIDWPMWKRKIRDLLDYHEGAIEVIDGKLKKNP
ncbi:hypothetical protein TNCV_348231 [Trichonephila clavipes]|nr:hypothetical protein TNCV_348231 [Trichonephila clavipes]